MYSLKLVLQINSDISFFSHSIVTQVFRKQIELHNVVSIGIKGIKKFQRQECSMVPLWSDQAMIRQTFTCIFYEPQKNLYSNVFIQWLLEVIRQWSTLLFLSYLCSYYLSKILFYFIYFSWSDYGDINSTIWLILGSYLLLSHFLRNLYSKTSNHWNYFNCFI